MKKDYFELISKFNTTKIENDALATKECISKAKKMLNEVSLPNEEKVSLYYSIATAYSDLARLLIKQDEVLEKDELITQSLYYFNMATNDLNKIKPYANDLFQRIYTNAAIMYSSNGRLIKALQLLDKTTYKNNAFPMAMAHRCGILEKYSKLYNHQEKSSTMIKVGYENLCIALSCEEAFKREGALDFFLGYKTYLEKNYTPSVLNKVILYEGISFGKRKKDKDYRTWTTVHSLNLNVLNDIMLNGLSAFDDIHLPDMRYLEGDGTYEFHFGCFNQIIQEYTSARYLLYNGQKEKKSVCTADVNVLQMDMYKTVESYSDFCIRTAFRIIYSLFDRIAFFINEYWKIGISIDKMSYKMLTNNERFCNLTIDNEMLKAIYWTSKEFYEIDYASTINPEAKKMCKLRNYMEHRYLAATLSDDCEDTKYIKYITTSELYARTIELFKLCRETIIYLVLAIEIEENRKAIEEADKGIKYTVKKFTPIPDICK